MCVSPIYNFCMTHTLIQIQSYLFIISQPKVSFQFSIFKDHTIIFIQSEIFWDSKWGPPLIAPWTPAAKYLFPNRFIYGAVLSLWTQRLMNIHDIQSLPFIPSIHHWLQRLDRGVLVKHCSVEPKDGSSSPRIANNLLPYLWIWITCLGKKIRTPAVRDFALVMIIFCTSSPSPSPFWISWMDPPLNHE